MKTFRAAGGRDVVPAEVIGATAAPRRRGAVGRSTSAFAGPYPRAARPLRSLLPVAPSATFADNRRRAAARRAGRRARLGGLLELPRKKSSVAAIDPSGADAISRARIIEIARIPATCRRALRPGDVVGARRVTRPLLSTDVPEGIRARRAYRSGGGDQITVGLGVRIGTRVGDDAATENGTAHGREKDNQKRGDSHELDSLFRRGGALRAPGGYSRDRLRI